MHRHPFLQLLLLAGLGSALACGEPAAPKAGIGAGDARYTETSDPNQTYSFVAQLIGDPNLVGDPNLLQGVLGVVGIKLTRFLAPDGGDYSAVLSGTFTRRAGLSITDGVVGDPNLEPILRIMVEPFGPRDPLFFELAGEGRVPAAVAARFIGDPDLFTAILRNAAGEVVASGNFARAPEMKRFPTAAFSGEFPGATGSGNTVVSGELRTFSFTARLTADGTARGEAQINNRSIGEMFQVDIDCLTLVDNVAIMSGVIARHTDPNAVGLTGIFGVLDAGEGATAATDVVSQVFFFRPATVTCREIDPALIDVFGAPIASGNVQVHGG